MIVSSFKITNNLIFINGKKLELPFPVADALEYKKSIVVRVDPPAREILNDNIYCFTLSGNFLWQIEPSPHGTQVNKPYVSINVSSSSNLIASNWNGVNYIVNIEDGSIEVKSFNK